MGRLDAVGLGKVGFRYIWNTVGWFWVTSIGFEVIILCLDGSS